MTNRVELSYILEKEPCDFLKITEPNIRVVYVWQDKKAYLEKDGALDTFVRKSEMNVEPGHGFMEIMSICESSIPTKIDDKISETYKTINEGSFVVEWHIQNNLLRIIWFQGLKTLKETKILASVMKYLEKMNLEIPLFPSIYD